MNRRTLIKAAAALPASFLSNFASAEETLPSLKLLLGFPAGGPSDVTARVLAEKLNGAYARTVFVENRPGAAGMIAAKAACVAAPDGSTILITPAPVITLLPHVYASMSFNALTDLVPVSSVCDFVHGLAIGPAVPESVQTLKQFLAWCKENPGRANCANPGEGSSPQFLTHMLSSAAGVEIQPVAYKGPGPGLIDVVGGLIAAIITPPDGTYLQYQKAGKIRVLATSGAERSQFFPNVPTFKESGYESMVLKEWIGAFMPAKTPPAIIERASAAIRTALAQKDVFSKFADLTFIPAPSSPTELGKSVKTHYEFWKSAVKRSGFKLL
jgi:tripartite-type tricarboxylate transporter receptor subunit TctC